MVLKRWTDRREKSMAKVSGDSIRVNLYVAPKYLEFFDAYASDMNLSRSAAFTVMIRDYMRMSEAQNQLTELNQLADKALIANRISDGKEGK